MPYKKIPISRGHKYSLYLHGKILQERALFSAKTKKIPPKGGIF